MALLLRGKNISKLLSRPLILKPFQVAHIADREREIIGKREIVGFGINGQPTYIDCCMVPFPAIRWREPTCELQALREKEKGDWNNLTLEEKKTLYRASFYQTFAEMKYPSGDWKTVTGLVLLLLCPVFWMFYFFKCTIYSGPLPDSFSEESRACQFRRILDLKMNPITGIASKWDYDRDTWK